MTDGDGVALGPNQYWEFLDGRCGLISSDGNTTFLTALIKDPNSLVDKLTENNVVTGILIPNKLPKEEIVAIKKNADLYTNLMLFWLALLKGFGLDRGVNRKSHCICLNRDIDDVRFSVTIGNDESESYKVLCQIIRSMLSFNARELLNTIFQVLDTYNEFTPRSMNTELRVFMGMCHWDDATQSWTIEENI